MEKKLKNTEILPPNPNDRIEQRFKMHMEKISQGSRLIKRNLWYDNYPFRIKEGNYVGDININMIELVPYQDLKAPVVYNESVFQLCFQDWDGDGVLKDDINGVEIFPSAFSGDELYDIGIIDMIADHPMNKIFQIKYNGQILSGRTLDLQLIVDLYYKKNCYI